MVIDLTGQRFGKLLVIERVENYKQQPQWLCQCDCGNNKIIRGDSLRKGATISCGCYSASSARKRSLANSIAGNRYGKLVAIERVENRVYRDNKPRAKWLCQCDCGNTIEVVRNALVSGNTKSCGCMAVVGNPYGRKFFVDLTGNRYGSLVVISKDESRGVKGRKRLYWLCQCDCGNMKIAQGNSLKIGHVTSCGCLSESSIAKQVKNYLVANYNAIEEYKVFRNPDTGYYLPYDVYVPKHSLFVEIMGEQHFRKDSYYNVKVSERYNITLDEVIKIRRRLDRIKKKFAQENGIYISIDLRKVKTFEKAIEYIEGFI